MGIKNGVTPKVILQNMRDKNCFTSSAEPTVMQLYNKISHLKKIMNLTDHIEDTHQMRQKVENHIVKLLAKSKLKSLPYNHTDHPPTHHLPATFNQV